MSKIRVLVKEPGKPAEVREIENTLEAFRAIVGGHIEAVRISDDIACYINEEGKLQDLAPNLLVPLQRTAGLEVICGPAVFFRADLEGNETSLTLCDIIACDMLVRRLDVAGPAISRLKPAALKER